ncbi:histidine phosphatase family protein [Chloroflexota bacterium]
MMQIILVRHGETELNVGQVFRGRIDVELNETGVKQAELLGQHLSRIKIETIYSSPLKRALKTAQIIASYHNLGVEITPGLMDLDFGKWQGLSHQEVRDKYEELYLTWTKTAHLVRMPGGERLNDVRERAVRLVDEVNAKYEGTVVMVSHRVVNKVLICALLGLDNSHFWNIRLDTCGITVFTRENGCLILTKHNDTSFLELSYKKAGSDF